MSSNLCRAFVKVISATLLQGVFDSDARLVCQQEEFDSDATCMLRK